MVKVGKVNIAGSEYSLVFHSDYNEINEVAKERDKRYNMLKEPWEGLDGYCDYSGKEIHVFTDKFTDPVYFQMIVRHELCHAFLFEIGYAGYGDEELIDKLSKWIPQINSIFQESYKIYRDNIRTSKQTKSD